MLFKSLRERILVFFSLLIIGIQAVSFLVVSTTSRDAEQRQLSARVQAEERVVKNIVEGQFAKLDSLSGELGARINAGDAASIEQELRRLSQLAGLPADSIGMLFFKGAGEAPLWIGSGWLGTAHAGGELRTALQSELEAASAATARRGVFNVSNSFYLYTAIPLNSSNGDGGLAGEGSLALAVPFLETIGKQVVQSLGRSLYIGEMAASAKARKLNLAELPAAVRSFPLALQERVNSGSGDLDRQKFVFMLLMAGALALTLLGGYALADELTRPLKELSRIAAQINAGDYTPPDAEFQQDEIGQLADTLKHMCTTIAEREQRITRLAYSDVLTGLPNRALFDDRLNRAVSCGLREGNKFSIALLDLDRFKYINDVLGHEAGDFVLGEVARRLDSVLRESDTVARLGGDEFALLLNGNTDYHVQTAINKILDVFDEPVSLNNQPIDVACSIGIARFPDHGEDSSLLMRRADMAMYAAKRFNAGFSYYTPECDQHQEEHLSLLGDIKRAVENDELQLYYQPKVELDGDAQVSVETLLRWQHPRRGLVPPSEFIPFAEQTGAIRLITRWLLQNAIRQCGVWYAQGLNIQMSLNISARDLIDPDFPSLVSQVLDDNKVPASLVCMEITESALMQDPVKARRTLDVLSSMGVKMSIDDYGTGYSSLAYVKNLPVKELKIDREFVSNMINNAEDSAIVKSTIELGHNLGMRVVAEGIEHDNEMQLLKSFGCDQGQGFLISHALDAGDLESWCRERVIESARNAGDATAPGEEGAGAARDDDPDGGQDYGNQTA